MPIAQPRRSAADDLLDQVDLSPRPVQAPQAGPQPAPTPTPTPAPKAVGAPRSQADALLDQVDQGTKPPQTFGHYASNVWDVVSPSNLAHAARDAVVPRSPDDWIGIAGLGPIRQLYEPSVDLAQKGIKSIREGKTLSGIRSLGNAAIPMFGPISEKAGEQLDTGDYVGAAGTMTGGGIAAFAPKAIGKYGPKAVEGIQGAGQGIAKKMYRSALRPTGARAAEVSDRLLAESIPVGTAASRPRRQAVLNEQGKLISGPLDAAPQDPTISHASVLNDLEALKGKHLKADYGVIDEVKQEFLDEMSNSAGLSPSEAFALKVKYQNKISPTQKAWQPEAVNPIKVQAWQKIVGNLGRQIVEQFPEVAEPMARYGPVKEAGRLLQNREIQSANRWPAGLASLAIGAETAIRSPNPLIGIPVAAATEAFLDPTLRSRLAIGLYKASGGTAVPKGIVRMGAGQRGIVPPPGGGAPPPAAAGPVAPVAPPPAGPPQAPPPAGGGIVPRPGQPPPVAPPPPAAAPAAPRGIVPNRMYAEPIGPEPAAPEAPPPAAPGIVPPKPKPPAPPAPVAAEPGGEQAFNRARKLSVPVVQEKGSARYHEGKAYLSDGEADSFARHEEGHHIFDTLLSEEQRGQVRQVATDLPDGTFSELSGVPKRSIADPGDELWATFSHGMSFDPTLTRQEFAGTGLPEIWDSLPISQKRSAPPRPAPAQGGIVQGKGIRRIAGTIEPEVLGPAPSGWEAIASGMDQEKYVQTRLRSAKNNPQDPYYGIPIGEDVLRQKFESFWQQQNAKPELPAHQYGGPDASDLGDLEDVERSFGPTSDWTKEARVREAKRLRGERAKELGGIRTKQIAPRRIATPVEAAAEEAKQPWQMTRDEFIQAGPEGFNNSGNYGWSKSGGDHAVAVQDAINEGDPVPRKVLADYPDLTKPPKPKRGKHIVKK